MNTLTEKQTLDLISILKKRFNSNMHRHENISFDDIESKLIKQPEKILSLSKMEETGGEPDVLCTTKNINDCIFVDFSKESPVGRRSYCYDDIALNSRKEHKPKGSAIGIADEMNVQLMDESTYRLLQSVEEVDLKTSSWLITPADIRKLGGAIYGDNRYKKVFIYHNGAESYYAARGFRAVVKI